MSEKFQQAKTAQAPEARGMSKDASISQVMGLNKKFEILPPKQQIELGKQMADGQVKAQKYKAELEEKGNLISTQEEKRLKHLIAQGEEQKTEARNKLIESCIPLVKHLVGVRNAAGENSFGVNDYVQEGLLGLVKAADNYDWREGKFSTFAYGYITGEMQRAERDKARLVKIPRSIYEAFPKMRRATDLLKAEMVEEPSDKEIGARSGLSEEEVVEIKKAANAEKTLLYYQAASDSVLDSPGEPYPIADPNADIEEDVKKNVLLGQIKKILTSSEHDQLDERSKKLLRLRFGNGMTQAGIAEELGISQMHVSRLEAKALAKMRELLNPQGDE